jgi:hypothetical protein
MHTCVERAASDNAHVCGESCLRQCTRVRRELPQTMHTCAERAASDNAHVCGESCLRQCTRAQRLCHTAHFHTSATALQLLHAPAPQHGRNPTHCFVCFRFAAASKSISRAQRRACFSARISKRRSEPTSIPACSVADATKSSGPTACRGRGREGGACVRVCMHEHSGLGGGLSSYLPPCWCT